MKYLRVFSLSFGLAFLMSCAGHLSVFTDFDFLLLSFLFLLAIFPFGMALVLMAIRKDVWSVLKPWCITGTIYLGLRILDPLPIGSYFGWFDSETWRSENTWAVKTPTKRRLMLGSLFWIKSVGWGEQEIQRNLGPTSEYFQDLIGDRVKKVLSYRIDNEDGFFSIDSQWLVFSLDETGKVLEKEIRRD